MKSIVQMVFYTGRGPDGKRPRKARKTTYIMRTYDIAGNPMKEVDRVVRPPRASEGGRVVSNMRYAKRLMRRRR